MFMCFPPWIRAGIAYCRQHNRARGARRRGILAARLALKISLSAPGSKGATPPQPPLNLSSPSYQHPNLPSP